MRLHYNDEEGVDGQNNDAVDEQVDEPGRVFFDVHIERQMALEAACGSRRLLRRQRRRRRRTRSRTRSRTRILISIPIVSIAEIEF